MTVVGGAWPLLVELTPAASRPWISGTSDNRVLSLIFEYNGVGRVDGQAGGPGGIGGTQFGGGTGPLRLLNSALGGQAGWLLGFAAVSALALLVRDPAAPRRRAHRLAARGRRRVRDHRRAVQLRQRDLPPLLRLAARPVRRRAGRRRRGALRLAAARARACSRPLAIAAGVATELVVLGDYPGQLRWLVPVLIGLCGLAAVVLAVADARGLRLGAALLAAGVLLIGPSVWAVDTLGRTLNGTFPEGGPARREQRLRRPGGLGGRSGARAAASRPARGSGAGVTRDPGRRRLRGSRALVCRPAPQGRVAPRGRARFAPPGAGSALGGGGPAAAASATRSAREVLVLRQGARRRHDRRLQPVQRRRLDHRRRRRRRRHRRLLRA